MNEFLNPYLRETNPLSNYYRIQQLLKQIEISTQILTIYLKQYETKKDISFRDIFQQMLSESNNLTRLLSELKRLNQPSPDTIPITISAIENIAKQVLQKTQATLLKTNMNNPEFNKAVIN